MTVLVMMRGRRCVDISVLRNPRHEQFAQLVATGKSPAEAYVCVGFESWCCGFGYAVAPKCSRESQGGGTSAGGCSGGRDTRCDRPRVRARGAQGELSAGDAAGARARQQGPANGRVHLQRQLREIALWS